MAETFRCSLPLSVTLMVGGHLSQVSPVKMSEAASVRSMPVAKAPSAPYMQVCESLPTTNWPGRARPFSTMIWWQTPFPTSKKWGIL
ncbi:MAG: hypothetical protein QM765_03890 [Myxococcales bacterium]